MKATNYLMICLVFAGCSKPMEEPVEERNVLSCFESQDLSINANDHDLTEEQEDFYFNVWKKEVMQRYDMTEEFITDHYVNVTVSSQEWNDGASVRIDYFYRFDWAMIRSHDVMLVRLNASNKYPQHDIPRDEMLDEEWVSYCIDHNISSSKITPIVSTPMLHASCEEALHAFQDASGFHTMQMTEVSLFVPGAIPRENGQPHMLGEAIIDELANKCAHGHYNLITGQFEAREGVCVVFN